MTLQCRMKAPHQCIITDNFGRRDEKQVMKPILINSLYESSNYMEHVTINYVCLWYLLAWLILPKGCFRFWFQIDIASKEVQMGGQMPSMRFHCHSMVTIVYNTPAQLNVTNKPDKEGTLMFTTKFSTLPSYSLKQLPSSGSYQQGRSIRMAHNHTKKNFRGNLSGA